MDPEPANREDRSSLGLVLALHRSPVLRFELRERPLPTGIELILRLAAASEPLVRDTAARMRESPARLVEAARFYVQQVLFEPGTDAYRILGVAADAPFERIRDHHHWLQRWVHPDRNDDGTSAPFAVRLNWAWQQLRNERARQAYDAGAEHRIPDAAARGTQSRAPVRNWTAVPVARTPRRRRWWQRGVLAAAFGGCLALLYLVVIRGVPAPGIAAGPTHLSQSTPLPPPERPTSATPRPASPAAARHATSIVAAAPRPARPPAPRSNAVVPPAADLPAPPRLEVAVSVTRVALQPVNDPVSGVAAARLALPVPLATVAHHATTAPRPAVPSTGALAARDRVPSAPAVRPPLDTATPTSVNVDPAVLLRRVALARQRVRSLVAYFRSAHDDAPGWQSAPAPFNAARQRAALRQRTSLPIALTFALESPVWQVDDERVAVDANYHVHRAHAVAERGRFELRMVWHGKAWQITRIQLAPRE